LGDCFIQLIWSLCKAWPKHIFFTTERGSFRPPRIELKLIFYPENSVCRVPVFHLCTNFHWTAYFDWHGCI
jgi:hypothetical protein